MISGLPQILISAGEPSGDKIAARTVEVLSQEGQYRFYGIGGDEMQNSNVVLLQHINSLTAIGFVDSVSRLNRWIKTWRMLKSFLRKHPPAVALLTDSPEFNLPLAKTLKTMGVPVVLYVGPQVWAWRKRRLEFLRKTVDVTALILPFEKELYERANVPAEFVGHPLLDEPPPIDRSVLRNIMGISENTKLVAMLPGSRPAEICRHLPVLTKSARQLERKDIRVVFAPGRLCTEKQISECKDIVFLPKPFCAKDLLTASDAAIVASGTATLEAVLCGVPFAAIYRTDPITYFIGKQILGLPYVSLPNWILNQMIFPEILQRALTEDNLVSTISNLLEPSISSNLKISANYVRQMLGQPGAAKRTAQLVLEQIR